MEMEKIIKGSKEGRPLGERQRNTIGSKVRRWEIQTKNVKREER